MNRLTRDQICGRALDMIDNPALDAIDRPNGTDIDAAALTVGWLQDGLDFFHNRFPWAGIVTSEGITITTSGTVNLPTTFIVDVADGITLTDEKVRLVRWPLQRYIDGSLNASPGQPKVYVVHPPVLRFGPTPDKSYAGTLWYYALPSVMSGGTIPQFPSDFILVEYVRLRGLEWSRVAPIGTAMEYGEKSVAAIRRSGLGGDPEQGAMRLTGAYGFGNRGRNDWMGDPTVR